MSECCDCITNQLLVIPLLVIKPYLLNSYTSELCLLENYFFIMNDAISASHCFTFFIDIFAYIIHIIDY